MNLQSERPRPAETGRATEPLKRDQWPQAEGKVHDLGGSTRLERAARGAGDDPLGVPVERIGRTVGGLGLALEAIEERRATRADNQRAGSAGQQLIEGERRRGAVERRGRQREEDVQAQRSQRTLERREQIVG